MNRLMHSSIVIALALTVAACSDVSDDPRRPAPTVSLEVDPSSVATGNTATLSWAVTDASSCTASGNGWSGERLVDGGPERKFVYDNETTFGLTCTGPGGTDSDEVRVLTNTSPLLVSVDFNLYLVVGGDTFDLSIAVSNPTSKGVTGVVVGIPIPEHIVILPSALPPNASCSGGTCQPTEILQWQIGGIDPGDTQRAFVTPTVAENVPARAVIEFVVTTSADEQDDTLPQSETIAEGVPKMLLSLLQAPVVAGAGDSVDYTLSYANTTATELTQVELLLTLPGPVELISSTGAPTANEESVITWVLGNVDLGESGSRTATVRVDPDLPDGVPLRASARAVIDGQGDARASSFAAVNDVTIECFSDSMCSTGERCRAGSCVNLCEGIVCDDGNQCTVDGQCNGSTGRCVGRALVPDDTPCDLGAIDGVCDGGTCVPVSACTGDTCIECVTPPPAMCQNGTIAPTVPCCILPDPPAVADACAGSESLQNPVSCTPTGSLKTHRVTVFEVLGDCNIGFDLDSCGGTSCINGGLAPGEGENGVDNAFAGMAPVLVGVGGNLGSFDQAFSDALCGLSGDTCQDAVNRFELEFAIDLNTSQGCANVGIIANGVQVDTAILNLGAPTADQRVCASGTLGTVPIQLGDIEGVLDNAVVRMTVSDGGFSNGRLGATAHADTAIALAEAVLEGAGAVVGQLFDIDSELSGNNSVACNALSGTYAIGGLVQ